LRIRTPFPIPPYALALLVFVVSALLVLGVLATFVLPDRNPPSAVAWVEVEDRLDGLLEVTWGPAVDDEGIGSYRVYRDGRLLAEVPGTTGSFVDDTRRVEITFEYRVSAVDTAGNEGPLSPPTDAASAPAPPVLVLGVWERTGGNATISLLTATRLLALAKFQAAVSANGSGIALPPRSLVDLPATRDGVTLSFEDADGDGLLGAEDRFVLAGGTPSTGYQLRILYVPTAQILVTSDAVTF